MADQRSVTVRDGERWASTMTALGRVIVGTAIVATVASLVLVQRFALTYRDGLAVTEESAKLVANSVQPIRTLAEDLADLSVTVVDGLALAQTLVETTQTIAESAGDASATNLADAADAAADIADRLAQTLEGIERLIPGNSTSIAEELRAFADGLEPVAEQLRTIGDQLSTAATDLDGGQATLASLADQLDVTATAIVDLGPSLDALDATATDLQIRAAAATDRVGLDLWLIRILFVAVGAVFVAVGILAQRFADALVVAPSASTS